MEIERKNSTQTLARIVYALGSAIFPVPRQNSWLRHLTRKDILRTYHLADETCIRQSVAFYNMCTVAVGWGKKAETKIRSSSPRPLSAVPDTLPRPHRPAGGLGYRTTLLNMDSEEILISDVPITIGQPPRIRSIKDARL